MLNFEANDSVINNQLTPYLNSVDPNRRVRNKHRRAW